jgi:hypothetical protein
MVSAWADADRLSLAQAATEEKSTNEITATPDSAPLHPGYATFVRQLRQS